MIVKCQAKQIEGQLFPDIDLDIAFKVVSRPAGDCPWFLLKVSHEDYEKHFEPSDGVSDTAAFFSQFDLNEEEQEEAE